MKAIITERHCGDKFITGDMRDEVEFRAYDKDGNKFEILYVGKQNMPMNLYNYDIDIEVKITLTPKADQRIVKEFK